jgi:hypothetical protein
MEEKWRSINGSETLENDTNKSLSTLGAFVKIKKTKFSYSAKL